MMRMTVRFVVAVLVGLLGTVRGAFAATTVPHQFTGGTTASATEVNDNFRALAAAIDQSAPGVWPSGNCAPVTIGKEVHQLCSPLVVNCPSGKALLIANGYSQISSYNEMVHVSIGTSSAALDQSYFIEMGGLYGGGAPASIPFSVMIVRTIDATSKTFYLNAQMNSSEPTATVVPVTFAAICIGSP